jgi:hypothetical protein
LLLCGYVVGCLTLDRAVEPVERVIV